MLKLEIRRINSKQYKYDDNNNKTLLAQLKEYGSRFLLNPFSLNPSVDLPSFPAG